VPSAEQVDNRRRGRAEDRDPQVTQEGMGPFTFTISNEGWTALPARPGQPGEARVSRPEPSMRFTSLPP
jgi:hypothetical protein